MLSSSQQLIESIKLGAIAHVLVHGPHLSSDAAEEKQTLGDLRVSNKISEDCITCSLHAAQRHETQRDESCTANSNITEVDVKLGFRGEDSNWRRK